MSANGEKADERPATVRFPVALYEEVSKAAKAERRSVSGQILHYADLGVRSRQQEEART